MLKEAYPALGCTKAVKILLISYISFYPCRSFSHLASLGFLMAVPVSVFGVAVVLEAMSSSFLVRSFFL